jgi:hypothetical protein
MAAHMLGVGIIDKAAGGDRGFFFFKIRELRRGREHLHLHAGAVHHLKAGLEFVGVSAPLHHACDLGSGSAAAQAVEQVEIFVGENVPVDVDAKFVGRRVGRLRGGGIQAREGVPGRQSRDGAAGSPQEAATIKRCRFWFGHISPQQI